MSNRKRNIKYEETDENFKYVCECCGHKFNRPGAHYERSEYWGAWTTEKVLGCPVCGGGYYDTKPW